MNCVAVLVALDFFQIVGQQFVDQLRDTGAMIRWGDPIGVLFEGGQSVSDGNGAFAHFEKGVIIFGVADAGDIARREPEMFEACEETGGFIDAGGQDHDGALIKDDLQFQAELADGLEDSAFVGLLGRQNDPPDGERGNGALAQEVDEFGWRGIGQQFFLARLGPIEQCAIFGHDEVEEVGMAEGIEQVGQFATRHQDQGAA